MKTKFSLIFAILFLGLLLNTACSLDDEDIHFTEQNTGGIEDPVDDPEDDPKSVVYSTGGIEDPVVDPDDEN